MRHTLLLLIGCFAVAGCAPSKNADPMFGLPAPDFEVQSLASASDKLTLSDLKGKAVIVDFWATWCGPCKMLSPIVEQVYEKYHAQGLEGMAISDESRKTVQAGEKSEPHKMPVYLDSNDVAANEYEVQGLPTVVIIGRSGKIVYHSTGYNQNPEDTLEHFSKAVEMALQ